MLELTEKELLRISRKISYILRHNPGSADLEMRDDGSVSLRELVTALGVKAEVVKSIVSADLKTRYIISGDRIWATQGHSIPVNVPMKTITESGILYHGTKTINIDSIFKNGLIPSGRQHVHLSHTVDAATLVAARRVGSSVILEIDGSRMLEEGFTLLEASNGVVLAESVPVRFISVKSF